MAFEDSNNIMGCGNRKLWDKVYCSWIDYRFAIDILVLAKRARYAPVVSLGFCFKCLPVHTIAQVVAPSEEHAENRNRKRFLCPMELTLCPKALNFNRVLSTNNKSTTIFPFAYLMVTYNW